MNNLVKVPFAVISYNDGITIQEDENGNELFYQESLPEWHCVAGFDNRNQAEEELLRLVVNNPTKTFMIEEDRIEPAQKLGLIYG
jgi:hypothetical protein